MLLGWNDVNQKLIYYQLDIKLVKPEILFAQIEDAEIQKQLDKLEATKTANKRLEKRKKAEPIKTSLLFEDFAAKQSRFAELEPS